MENSSERTVNSFSLTFVQATAEESFLESRRGVMIRAIFWSSLVLIFLMLVNCAYLVLAVLAGDLEAPGLRSVLLHRAFICGIMLFMLSLAAGFGCRPCCHFPTWKIESTAAALLAIFMPAVVFIDGHYMLKLYAVDGIYLRRDDGICLDYASDTRLMLTWIAMLTCTHFFMNLRWYTLLPCQISGLLSYMFCAALGSPEGVLLVMNLALFAGITALASLAKRGLEHHERHSMLQLISERVRRFESDFKLEQAQSMSVASPSSASMRQREIDARSMVTDQTGQTGFTQMIFDVKNNCRDQLDSMMKLGEQEHWLVEAKQLRFDPKELIGRGNYGVILAGDMLGMPVAVKLPLASASLSLPDLANELRFLRRVRHPHIVAFQGACVLPEAEMLFLVEELVEGASLQALSQDKLNLETNQKHAVLLGICRALRYLHGLRPAIAHGDLKPTNVLITTRDQMPKLIDFGLSRIRANKSRQLGGTPRYMAPEALMKVTTMSLADKADVFSFGRVVFFVLTATNPLKGLSVQDVMNVLQRRQVSPLDWGPTVADFQEPAMELTDRCLAFEPTLRPSAEEVEKALCSWLPSAAAVDAETTQDHTARLVSCCRTAAMMYLGGGKNQI